MEMPVGESAVGPQGLGESADRGGVYRAAKLLQRRQGAESDEEQCWAALSAVLKAEWSSSASHTLNGNARHREETQFGRSRFSRDSASEIARPLNHSRSCQSLQFQKRRPR